jgi:hypothetical protein
LTAYITEATSGDASVGAATGTVDAFGGGDATILPALTSPGSAQKPIPLSSSAQTLPVVPSTLQAEAEAHVFRHR